MWACVWACVLEVRGVRGAGRGVFVFFGRRGAPGRGWGVVFVAPQARSRRFFGVFGGFLGFLRARLVVWDWSLGCGVVWCGVVWCGVGVGVRRVFMLGRWSVGSCVGCVSQLSGWVGGKVSGWVAG